jgi:hypothetical protein
VPSSCAEEYALACTPRSLAEVTASYSPFTGNVLSGIRMGDISAPPPLRTSFPIEKLFYDHGGALHVESS